MPPLKKEVAILTDTSVNDIAYSFQKSLIEALCIKTFKAARMKHLSRIVISGGVASNSALRDSFTKKANELGIDVYFPSKILCTDNAAMIGYIAYEKMRRGIFDNLTLDSHANLSL
jgi:N6-L-threonylcarbamoyladenine synthase